MKKPKIKISLIDQKGHMGCHRGHRIGDTFDFDTERGALCPMAMHVLSLTLTFWGMGENSPANQMAPLYSAVQMWM